MLQTLRSVFMAVLVSVGMLSSSIQPVEARMVTIPPMFQKMAPMDILRGAAKWQRDTTAVGATPVHYGFTPQGYQYASTDTGSGFTLALWNPQLLAYVYIDTVTLEPCTTAVVYNTKICAHHILADGITFDDAENDLAYPLKVTPCIGVSCPPKFKVTPQADVGPIPSCVTNGTCDRYGADITAFANYFPLSEMGIGGNAAIGASLYWRFENSVAYQIVEANSTKYMTPECQKLANTIHNDQWAYAGAWAGMAGVLGIDGAAVAATGGIASIAAYAAGVGAFTVLQSVQGTLLADQNEFRANKC